MCLVPHGVFLGWGRVVVGGGSPAFFGDGYAAMAGGDFARYSLVPRLSRSHAEKSCLAYAFNDRKSLGTRLCKVLSYSPIMWWCE